MAIPSQNEYHSATLRHYRNGQELRLRDIEESIAQEFQLTNEDLQIKLSSGTYAHNNRIRWALVSLARAGLLTRVEKGLYKISPEGISFINAHPSFTEKDLMVFPEFYAWVKNNRTTPKENKNTSITKEKETDVFTTQASPEETLDNAIRAINDMLSSDLLELIKKKSPRFFEQLVVDLMLAMGYGGSVEDAGQSIGQSGDGGIDGIIKEDRLGLSNIYLQAKRWEGTVGRPVIQAFAGALMGRHATRGVFITTSNFSAEAIDYATHLPQPIILIDGEKLVQLMIEYNVGVTTRQTYEVKRLDLDYFSEDE